MALPLPTLLPDWLPDHVCDAALFQSAAQTHRRMVALRTALDRTPAATPMERAVLRVLVVHAWRRIALRAPILPDNVFPVGWAGADCRSLNAALLAMLARPTLAQLDDHPIESIPCNIT
jgi:phenylacetic acid degradation operon negative regulatory protein